VKQIKLISFRVANEDEQRDLWSVSSFDQKNSLKTKIYTRHVDVLISIIDIDLRSKKDSD
jgi:hypothetical protein